MTGCREELGSQGWLLKVPGYGHDDVSGDVTSGGGSAARSRKLTGERWRFGTNGGHQDVERDAANSPMTKTDGEGADKDGGNLATTMATSPSDDDDRNGGGARLERRRRQRHEVTRR
uniref:DUF834 domain-containing protein n=1 Tax=Oryza sativa subsp. japonica TaxID=39947 RepID=Q6ZAZ5_ORYSJ|nr:hypothetical protein [Oryza sativa Japonica Group]